MPAELNSNLSNTEIMVLKQQVIDLQEQVTELQAYSQTLWDLLILIGRRLQMSSTSIKMAVSSMLDYDIFWDPSASYEFLQIIDSSTDQTFDLVALLTLAFRSQAKSLEISPEPHSIQEILETLSQELVKKDINVNLVGDYQSGGKSILVDYQYFVLAFTLIVDALIGKQTDLKNLEIRAFETPEFWQLSFNGFGIVENQILQHFFRTPKDLTKYEDQILPENTLKLIVACRILYLQKVELVDSISDKDQVVQFSIPIGSDEVEKDPADYFI